MREAEWIERLWQQVGQLGERIVTKDDVRRLEEKLEGLATRESVEKLAGKLDTLLINAATKIEVGRIEKQIEHAPSKEDVQRLETRFMDALPHLITKQEWSAVESRLARTLTKDEFAHTISALREEFETFSQRLSDAVGQLVNLKNLIIVALLLNGLALVLLGLVLLKMR